MIVSETITYRGHVVTYDELKPSSHIALEVQCDVCGKRFTSNKWRILRNGHQMCQACALAVKQRKDLTVGAVYGRLTVLCPSDRAGYSVCECSCDAHTVREFNNQALLRGTTRSCGCLKSETGKRIADEYLSQYHHGENHPMWRGGISPERNRFEKTNAYKAFRKAVFERDGFKCRKCGSTDDVCVHHIRNYESNPELRTDVDNGACLCRTCHREFHHRYGLLDTTPEQFAEFCAVK